MWELAQTRLGANGVEHRFLAIDDSIAFLLSADSARAVCVELPSASLGQLPGFWEFILRLGLVVSQVKRDVGKGIALFGLLDQALDGVAQVAFVLRAGREFLARHAYKVRVRVVTRSNEFEECLALCLAQVFGHEVLGAKLDNDLVFGRMLFSQVCRVSETEDLVLFR